MYFAHAPYAADLDQQIDRAVRSTLASHPQTKVYALIDATLLTPWNAELWTASLGESKNTLQSVYLHTPLQELEEIAPFVMQIGPKELQAVLPHCSGTPFLSIVCSPLDVAGLCRHLAQFCQVQPPDKLLYPTRFADTATLPLLLQAMTAKQQLAFVAGFDTWHIIGRDGMLQILTLPEQVQRPPEHDDLIQEYSYTISDRSFASIVDGADPDRLLCNMGTENPHLVKNRHCAVLYSMACLVVEQMNQLKIEAEPDRADAFMQAMNSQSKQAAVALLQQLAPSA